MPTVGWIQERDIERFLAATTSVPDPAPPKAPRYACPFCHATFEANAALGKHLASDHVGGRPFVTFGGLEPPSAEVIRKRLSATGIEFFNTTTVKISFDHQTFSEHRPQEAKRLLASGRDKRIWLRVENKFDAKAAPLRTDYDLQFRVYGPKELLKVDRLFVSMLGRPDPAVSDVDGFLQAAEQIGGDEYAGALADYVLAVLIKDGDVRSGIRPGERIYRRKYNRALRVLKDFDRPLSRLISALIRFSSNDFSAVQRTGFAPLDAANAWLVRLTGNGGTPASAAMFAEEVRADARANVCPVDNGSDAVMRKADQLASLRRWGLDVEEALRSEVGLSSLDPLDRVKLLAFWADTAFSHAKPLSAAEPLRLLVGNDCLGQWAESKLQECEE